MSSKNKPPKFDNTTYLLPSKKRSTDFCWTHTTSNILKTQAPSWPWSWKMFLWDISLLVFRDSGGGTSVEGSGGRVSLVCNKFSRVYMSIKCQASGTGILKLLEKESKMDWLECFTRSDLVTESRDLRKLQSPNGWSIVDSGWFTTYFLKYPPLPWKRDFYDTLRTAFKPTS